MSAAGSSSSSSSAAAAAGGAQGDDLLQQLAKRKAMDKGAAAPRMGRWIHQVDGARVVQLAKHECKLLLDEGPCVRLKRTPSLIETQYRYTCKSCALPLAYLSRPFGDKTNRILYLVEGAFSLRDQGMTPQQLREKEREEREAEPIVIPVFEVHKPNVSGSSAATSATAPSAAATTADAAAAKTDVPASSSSSSAAAASTPATSSSSAAAAAPVDSSSSSAAAAPASKQ